MGKTLWLTVVAGLAGAAAAPAAEVVLENPRMRAVLGEDAVWRSLGDKPAGKELCAADKRVSLAAVELSGRWHNADRASLTGDQLTVSFDGCDTRLTYAVTATDDWIALRLEKVFGARPGHVTLVRLPVAVTEHVGSRLGAAWNDRHAVCLRAINLQTQVSCARQKDHTLLSAAAQDFPGPKLEGTGAAIIVSPTPELKPILVRLAAAFDLVRNEQEGVASRDLPIARQSYWFLDFAEKDVDRVIDYCRKTGIRQVMLGCGSWCTSVGHFTFNTNRYPDGVESLRRTVAKLHEAGILVGMHTFASKISKTDPYVTPVPSRGFWVDMTAALAGDLAADEKTVRTTTDLSQWPGSPVCRQKVWEGHVSKHQDVIIDDEIIRYESIGPEGKWDTFLGCQRGAWGTRAAAHKAAAECRHYGVDGCINGYIIDQDSPLFQESTSRLAEVFNTCDFDMVYFDGSEDVDRRRYDYYASNAHAVPMRKFTRRPLIHQGGGFTHGLYHSFTRSGTVDQYPGTYLAHLHAGGTIDRWPTCKDHIDRSVGGVHACEEDMTPGELGWFGIGPKSGAYDGLQFDEIEYLMCKSLAYNAPISLQTGFARMEAHPLTPDILEIVRTYEEIRLAGTAPPETRERLKAQGRDFILLPAALGKDATPQFAVVEGVPEVAGAHDVRAMVGPLGDGAIATVWHYVGKEGTLVLDVPEVEAYDVRGGRVTVEKLDAKTASAVPLGSGRLTLHFPRLGPDAVRERLGRAKLELRKPVVLWIQGEDCREIAGAMSAGSKAGVDEPGALGDVVLSTGPIDRSGKAPSYCEYRVAIPRKARWTLWARVRYPTGGDMSFGLVRPGEPVTLSGDQVLGNCGANDKKWHWTGRGGGVSTVPPGSPIILALDAGELVFRIYPREGPGTLPGNPRLDCLCLTEDGDYVPTDADAKAGLK